MRNCPGRRFGPELVKSYLHVALPCILDFSDKLSRTLTSKLNKLSKVGDRGLSITYEPMHILT
eukprot:241254-Pyramimonas_sp.AAC.1